MVTDQICIGGNSSCIAIQISESKIESSLLCIICLQHADSFKSDFNQCLSLEINSLTRVVVTVYKFNILSIHSNGNQ